jgi:hypothetical protein
MAASTDRTVYAVVAANGNVAFQTNNLALAVKTQQNYPGSRLEPEPTVEALAALNPKAATSRRTASKTTVAPEADTETVDPTG